MVALAGTIFVKEGVGIPLSSVAFNAVVEFSRPFFEGGDGAYLKEIYAPLDEGGMDMISISEQGVEGFNAYYKGARKAYDQCLREGRCGGLGKQYFDMVFDAWRELIELLEADERFLK
ncbi:hypothetical protein [Pseudomonas batumici]|uniref:hypothetical protein n=1 Tax=Pseudomonas batumici TaxID=226910 RepID=UPI0012ECF02B|nr:hypothetical protein [Pseudomonas batumici]